MKILLALGLILSTAATILPLAGHMPETEEEMLTYLSKTYPTRKALESFLYEQIKRTYMAVGYCIVHPEKQLNLADAIKTAKYWEDIAKKKGFPGELN